ncbi:MAG: trypsin-like peptidase domain-containing protein, partial [Planctomycetes bacterium]|nr:trypsin-like peptidase domain-containing protein [Planctomycetota bacterium]
RSWMVDWTSRRDEDVQRFVRSVQAVKALRHENLVALYAAGKTGPWCWTASELVEGPSLAQLMEKAGDRGRLPWRQVLKIGLGVAAALEAAAEQRLVHRNITPGNILVRQRDGVAKLNDLTLVKALEGTAAARITQPGETLGELPYIAPEQLTTPRAVDGRADIYGLGATLYAALTGRPPIEPAPLSEMVRQIVGCEPEPPTRLNPQVPPELEAVILKMLARRPQDRHQSPSQLVGELRALAAAADSPAQAAFAAPAAVVTDALAAPVIVQTEGEPLPFAHRRRSRRRPRPGAAAVSKKNQRRMIYGLVAGAAAVAMVVGVLGLIGGGDRAASVDAGRPGNAGNRNPALTAAGNGALSDAKPLAPDEPADDGQRVTYSLTELIRHVEPSVVSVNVKSADGEGNGSGFVIDRDGIVATNMHVIDGATSVEVVFADGTRFPVTGVLKFDEARDIALLKIDAPAEKLKALPLAAAPPEKGENVVAFGAPFGLSFTASEGIVSAVRSREELWTLGIGGVEGTWVQTTAPISPGNSGGPLVNMSGEVVAANTLSIVIGQNLNFAISSDDIRQSLAAQAGEPFSFDQLAVLSGGEGGDFFGDAPAGEGEGAADPEALSRIGPEILAALRSKVAAGSQSLKVLAGGRPAAYPRHEQRLRRALSTLYRAHGNREAAWSDDAFELLDGLNRRSVQASLQIVGRLRSEECDDPLAMTVSAWLLSHGTLFDRMNAVKLNNQALEALDDADYPLLVRYRALTNHATIASRLAGKSELVEEYQTKGLTALLELISQPDLTDEDRRLYYQFVVPDVGGAALPAGERLIEEFDGAEQADPWLVKMLAGSAHHRLGWQARGGGFSQSVTRDGYRRFVQHLNAGRVYWLEAWHLAPHLPDAPTALVALTMAVEGVAGDDVRFWFEQAVSAEFDHLPAYKATRWALRPRWGGSHLQMLSFARECLATARFDTEVPMQYHLTLVEISSELGEEWQRVYRLPGVVDDFHTLVEGYKDAPGQAGLRPYNRTMLAAVLAMAGRDEEARKLLAELVTTNTLDPRTFQTAFAGNVEPLIEPLLPQTGP